jgi:copper chaperone NosL
MTYQPPLIGSKKLLNFTAASWPATGGWLLIAAALVVAAALYITLFRKRRPAFAAAAISMAASAACAGSGPRPFKLGEDACDFCRMAIVDARYGGEAVTTTGKVYTFDSIECLAGWARTAPSGTILSLYVIDLQHPETFVRVEQAGFLKDVMIKSPMGKSIAGFVSPAAAEQQRAMLGGHVATWADLLADTLELAHSS